MKEITRAHHQCDAVAWPGDLHPGETLESVGAPSLCGSTNGGNFNVERRADGPRLELHRQATGGARDLGEVLSPSSHDSARAAVGTDRDDLVARSPQEHDDGTLESSVYLRVFQVIQSAAGRYSP